MAKINQKEYEILKGLDDQWKWIARDERDDDLFAHTLKPIKQENGWANIDFGYKFLQTIYFQFIKWDDKDPHNIAELIEEYEGEIKVQGTDISFKSLYEPQSPPIPGTESEETEVKNIEWFKEEFYKVVDQAKKAPMGGGGELKYIHIDYIKKIIDQLDELEDKKITLQDTSHRLWELPLNKRKYWLEQLNDEFKEGYVVPLGLKTTDGEEQYLTYNGSYFASRRGKSLQQTFATLEEIPDFYRELAEKIL